MLCAPLAGQRRVQGPERRTALDFAPVLQEWVDAQYPQAEQMGLVMDTLHTHTLASLYEAFAPAAARRVRERRERHDTPQHGRWLPMAATARRVLTTPCLDRWRPDPPTRRQAVAAWEQRRTQARGTVEWRFTTPEASIKLQRLYPSIQLC